MAKTATVRARIEPELKNDVERLFRKIGLTTTEAINLFYHQVRMRNGLPFNVAVPNRTTRKTLKETDSGVNLVRCTTADDLFKKLDI